MRYIVKNCPAYLENGLDFCFAKNVTEAFCHNCTDCVIKQVIEKCKEVQFDTFFEKKLDEYNPNVAHFAKQILAEFEIEEVKE